MRERWLKSKRWADQQIAASRIMGDLPMGTRVPTRERELRELVPLEGRPELIAEAIDIAASAPVGGLRSETLPDAVRFILAREKHIDRLENVFTSEPWSLPPHCATATVGCAASAAMVGAAARHLLQTRCVDASTGFEYLHVLPRPAAWEPAADVADLDTAWRTSVMAAAKHFTDWAARVNLPDIASDVDIIHEHDWCDAALEQWTREEAGDLLDDWSDEDRRRAAIGYAFTWLSPACPPPLMFGDAP